MQIDFRKLNQATDGLDEFFASVVLMAITGNPDMTGAPFNYGPDRGVLPFEAVLTFDGKEVDFENIVRRLYDNYLYRAEQLAAKIVQERYNETLLALNSTVRNVTIAIEASAKAAGLPTVCN